MMLFRSLSVWVLAALTAALILAQATNPTPGAPLFGEAITLHGDGKVAEALAKVKEAVALEPKNGHYARYQTELNSLVERDRLYQHALTAPADAEQTAAKLAAYLVKPAKSDEDKARLIFRWITDRIAYDAAAFRSGKIPDQSALAVLKTRLAVCEGYSNLFQAIAQAAGLEVVKIGGQGKGAGYQPGEKSENHAWNAVKINGQWRLVDSTWGAGDLTAKGFGKRFKEDYFLAVPEQLIFTHLPSDPKWQFVSPLVKPDQFGRWPRVSSELFRYGISGKTVRARLEKEPTALIVEPLSLRQAGPRLVLKNVPLERNLKVGDKYRFQIEAPGFDAMILSNGPKPVKMIGANGVFSADVEAQKGPLVIAGRFVGAGGSSYSGVVRYVVE